MSLVGSGAIKRKKRVNLDNFTAYVISLKDDINADETIKEKTKVNLNTLLNKLGAFDEKNIYKEFLKLVDDTKNISSKYSILQRFSSIAKKTKLNNVMTDKNRTDLQKAIKRYSDEINGDKLKREPNDKLKKNKIVWSELVELVEKLHGMDKLLLALYVYQPPMRADYNSVRIIENDDEIDSDKENYYNVNTKEFTILEFKNCDKFEPIVFDANKKVVKIINKSLKETPRKYLIYPYVSGKESLINDNVSPNYLAHRISKITKDNLDGKDIGINQLRKYFVAENNLDTKPYEEVEEDNKIMCHSMKTAQEDYYKNF